MRLLKWWCLMFWLKYNEPQSEAYNRMSIDGMKWSMSKVRH